MVGFMKVIREVVGSEDMAAKSGKNIQDPLVLAAAL